MGEPSIDAVIFDMGGVVVRLKPLREVLAGIELPREELWERWIRADAVRDYESGRCTLDVFADDLIAELGVELDPSELIDRFARFPLGLFEGAEQLVAEVRAKRPVAVLSNTNDLHWDTQLDHEILQRAFDREYLSYRLGLVKPDPAIYEHAIADLAAEAGRVLFLDDNQVNVDGARAVGMRSERVLGPSEARAALIAHSVLES